MFVYRKLSFHPSFSLSITVRQQPTDTVDHYDGARIAYRARRAASLENRIVAQPSYASPAPTVGPTDILSVAGNRVCTQPLSLITHRSDEHSRRHR